MYGSDQAEVGDLDRAALLAGVADEHVLRLDVPVHQPGTVRGGERGEHRLHDRERERHGQRAPLVEQVTQGAAVDQLHDQVDEVTVR